MGRTSLSFLPSNAVFKDLLSYDRFRDIVDVIFDFSLFIGIDVGEVLEDFFFRFRLTIFSFFTIERIERPDEFIVAVFFHGSVEIFGNMVEFHFSLGLARDFCDLFDERAYFFDFFVTERDRADHFRVGNFFRARFDHQNCVFRAREGKMNRALFFLRDGGIDHILTVDTADDNAARRTCPRNIRNGKRDGRTDHGDGLGRDIGIDGKRGGHHHYVVKDSLGKQRADRTINQSADQNRFIGSPALSLFEAAGNFTHGEHFFFVIDGQGEEIHSFPRLIRHTNGDVHHRVAATDEACAVRLFRVLADFYGKFSPRIIRFENFAVF